MSLVNQTQKEEILNISKQFMEILMEFHFLSSREIFRIIQVFGELLSNVYMHGSQRPGNFDAKASIAFKFLVGGNLRVTYLTKNNINVTFSMNSTEAMEKLNKNKFDCILLDFNLGEPKRNGDWVVSEIRKDSKNINFNTPILIISGYIGYDHAVLEKQIQGMIEKPVSSSMLVQLVRKLAGDKKAS